MTSQICLKWNSFLNNIATSFESLWEEEGLVDVTLASDGQCLTAHKVILSASSPFFKKVFQTNPCRHPVIILQDVHFSELEALLIFIYKGEVNIEQKNLPALLKAAETLQIRGLSGGDIFAKESYKRLVDLDQSVSEDTTSVRNEAPKKKQKLSKQQQNNSILETVLTPRMSQSESTTSESIITSEHSGKNTDYIPIESLPSPGCHHIEMKMEPLEMTVEDLPIQSATEKDTEDNRLDTGQVEEHQGSSKPMVTVIAEARQTRTTPSPKSFPTSSPQQNSPNIEKESPDSPNSSRDDGMQFEQQPESSTTRFLKDRVNAAIYPGNFPPFADGAANSNCLEGALKSVEEGGGGAVGAAARVGSGGSGSTVACGNNNAMGGCTIAFPPFPCPFCDRAYTSWGFRRRHIKAVHTISPSLNCKWCLQILPTHTAWRRHVMTAHNLSASDAHNGLLILEEAHMVLQIARPTRLDTLVNIIKQSSQQNNNGASSGSQDNSQMDNN